jgi:hypothetical protein
MTRAFRPGPNHPAVRFLVQLHADLGGKLLQHRKEGERLSESMQHVEHVIKLFDPVYDVRQISARRRQKGNGWFRRGTIIRRALEVLKQSSKPLMAREVAQRMLIERGIALEGVGSKAMRSLTAAVQASLTNHNGKTVQHIGDAVPRRWTIMRDQK